MDDLKRQEAIESLTRIIADAPGVNRLLEVERAAVGHAVTIGAAFFTDLGRIATALEQIAISQAKVAERDLARSSGLIAECAACKTRVRLDGKELGD